MGEAADMILEGECCQFCGEFFHDDEAPGYPRSCGCDGSSNERPSQRTGEGKRRRNRKRKARVAKERREKLKKFDPTGWKQLSEHHFRKQFEGKNLDHWPSSGKYMFDGVVYKSFDDFLNKKVKNVP